MYVVFHESLKDNYIPGDLSPSQRYFAREFIRPEIIAHSGLIRVPKGPGLGVEVDEDACFITPLTEVPGLESNMNLIESLNIEYFCLHSEKDKFEAKMNLTTFHSQPFGMLHGGATCAFGEIVAGMASYDMLEKSKVPAGQTLVAYHFKPKKIEGYLLARGMLMHQGKRTHVWRIDMYDENELLISSVTVTNAIVDK